MPHRPSPRTAAEAPGRNEPTFRPARQNEANLPQTQPCLTPARAIRWPFDSSRPCKIERTHRTFTPSRTALMTWASVHRAGRIGCQAVWHFEPVQLGGATSPRTGSEYQIAWHPDVIPGRFECAARISSLFSNGANRLSTKLADIMDFGTPQPPALGREQTLRAWKQCAVVHPASGEGIYVTDDSHNGQDLPWLVHYIHADVSTIRPSTRQSISASSWTMAPSLIARSTS